MEGVFVFKFHFRDLAFELFVGGNGEVEVLHFSGHDGEDLVEFSVGEVLEDGGADAEVEFLPAIFLGPGFEVFREEEKAGAFDRTPFIDLGFFEDVGGGLDTHGAFGDEGSHHGAEEMTVAEAEVDHGLYIDAFDGEESLEVFGVLFGIADAVHGHGVGVVFVPVGFIEVSHRLRTEITGDGLT